MIRVFILLFLCSHLLYGQKIQSISLNGKWALSYGAADANAPTNPAELKNKNWPSMSAIVPGNVELDMLSAGLIQNPEVGNHVYDLRKYEAYQWWYSRNFKTPEIRFGERLELNLEGLDCFGTIWINNQLVGKTDNMLINHRFDITSIAQSGKTNTLTIRIDPAVAEGAKYANGVIGTRMDMGAEAVNVRKAPHMYGWDIMPRLISAGLWRDVQLEIIKPTRLRQVYWMTNSVDVANHKAQLILDYDISTDYPTVDGLTLEIALNKGGKLCYEKSVPVFTASSRQKITLENVDFWWPRGYGDPTLYQATLKLIDQHKKVLDESVKQIGIRTAELVHSEVTTKEKPGEFVFKVNGEAIFIKGTNWVPLDALHSRDKQHLNDVFAMITDLNCNMIRCWGGNVYEDHDFFDLCDQNGVLVWQDFAMGCTTYPQNNNFAERITEEAINVVLKLRQHPSLILWSGNNENDQSLEWTLQKHPDPAIDRISREILPRVIWEFDPIRSYLPSSPYSSDEYIKNYASGARIPEVHLWGPRGYYKDRFYTSSIAHFVSEIGYHGCPNRSSLEKMFDSAFVYPWDKEGNWNDQWQTKAVRAHPESTFTSTRNELMRKQVKAVFGESPADLDQFIFASQVVQAEAMKYFIELWRMEKFRKTGIIWWNLRDGWPIISDAVVDFYNSKKLAYFYIKKVQPDACVMIGDSKEGKHPIVAVNDTRTEKHGSAIIKDADSGAILLKTEFTIPINGKALIGELPASEKQAMWLIDYTMEGKKFTNHYLCGKAPFKLSDYQNWAKKLNLADAKNLN